MDKDNTRTYEARIAISSCADQRLHEFSKYFAKLKRCLFADIAAGKKTNDLKSDYITRYQITARHFNSIRVSVEGKIASIKARQPEIISEKKDRIKSLKKKISCLEKKKGNKEIVHQKKRRLHGLQKDLNDLETDRKNAIVRMCFGSKKLFRAQFNLKANGYANHEEWREDWQKVRSRELFFLGSKDEISGNQSCSHTRIRSYPYSTRTHSRCLTKTVW